MKTAEQIDNYDWCPIYPRLSAESGDTLEVVSKDKFPKYLADLKKWPYYFFFSDYWITGELAELYGRYDTKFSVPCEPIIKNRYGKVIAGTYHIQARKEEERESFATTGKITLLPLIESLSAKEAVTLVLEDLIGVSHKVAPLIGLRASRCH